MDPRYPIKAWRPFYDIAACWSVIAFAWWLSIWVSWWFLPVSFILVANRILALSLLCHEGLHRTLHSDGKWNDFLGRYLCAFPTFISFSKYRRLHLLHHSAVGSKNWDPDRHLYERYPQSFWTFFLQLLWRVLTLRTAYDFILYYTDYYEAATGKRGTDGGYFIFSRKSDFFYFAIFKISLIAFLVSFDLWFYFLVLYFAPLLLLTQPYVILMGGIQHGPARFESQNVSRTVMGSKLYMWLLLPLDINYHAEHHENPNVPHYWLKQRSIDMRAERKNVWTESYAQTMRSLF